MDIGYIFSGLLVGLLVGITGVGGGSLMTPLLMFLFGFASSVAVGTDLLFAAITKSGGVLVHHGKHRSVEWRIVGLLAAGSLPASIATLFVLNHYARLGHDITHLITYSLGIALILTALALFFRAQLQQAGKYEAAHTPGRFHHLQAPATIGIGLALGVLVTMSSVGAGALGTVALLFLYPRLPTLKIVGTDLAHAIPLTAIAGFGHWQLGHVNFILLGSLLIGSLPGIWIGSHFSAKIPERYLRPILASVLMLIGFKFVL
ncbi:sulfite exporter TauE/SafE [mine drainage metagenome]|uniref:Sulfite exporter TauE/SafE n=1 Tax=mine drainage metagenome TaxID=410659 RepID=A0A1J5QP09_9ZZZZ